MKCLVLDFNSLIAAISLQITCFIPLKPPELLSCVANVVWNSNSTFNVFVIRNSSSLDSTFEAKASLVIDPQFQKYIILNRTKSDPVF